MNEQPDQKDHRSLGTRAVGAAHQQMIFSRRVRVLVSEIAKMLPAGTRVLDVGAGSGNIAAAILAQRPDLKIEGVDVLVRGETLIPVREYDGQTLPFADRTFDYALLIDVLHHTDDPSAVLREVSRVAPSIIVKDHYRNGLLAKARLRLMDWVGNAPHCVRLPYNYLSRDEWKKLWKRSGLEAARVIDDVPLYPAPLSWIFGHGLHFLADVRVV